MEKLISMEGEAMYEFAIPLLNTVILGAFLAWGAVQYINTKHDA